MADIITYKNNTKYIIVDVVGLASLSGYTATLTCKRSKADTVELFTANGTITDLSVTIMLTPAMTNIAHGDYEYDVTITDGTNIYTVALGKLKIVDNVKY